MTGIGRCVDDSAVQAELTRLRAKNEQLRKALEPLAKTYHSLMAAGFNLPPETPLREWVKESLPTFGDCRRAAELLKPKPSRPNFIATVKAMSTTELVQAAIDAGINNPDGTLTDHYKP